MSIKPSEALRFLGAVVVALVLGALLMFRITGCTPLPRPVPPPPAAVTPALPSAGCAAKGWETATQANAWSLRALVWSPFGRPETGWETYAPLVGREIRSACPPDSPGFSAALAAWQGARRLTPDGIFRDTDFLRLKTEVQLRRPFVQLSAQGVCPAAPPTFALATAAPGEAYGGKAVQLRPAALAAWRAMAAAARAESAEVRADPRNLTIFSGFRDPQADAIRCATEGNCDGVARASCSAHRTGLAADLYVGQAPGFGPDSTADPNRLAMTRGATYRWLLSNASRFGFVNYPFEPWHWEWTGEAP